MKIELEIPDWVEEKLDFPEDEIYIHSYTELIAIRRHKKWYVKTSSSRCDMCGNCCKNLGNNFPYRGEDGTCIYLKDNKCSMGIHKPFSCIMDFHDDPRIKPKNCTEEFKEV